MKKILAIVLSLCLAFSMMPFAVVAAEPEVDAHNHSHALADGDGVQANGEAEKILPDESRGRIPYPHGARQGVPRGVD